MTTLERTVERREFYNGPPKRVSWGGIFAGAFVALAVMSVLGALGVAIGAEVIDPAQNDMPSATAYTWAAGIWWIVSGMIAIFLGALVAARLAGGSRGLEGPLHGVVTWAVVTMTTLFFLTTAIGSLIGGAFGVMRTSAVVAAQGAEAAGVDVSDIQQQLGQKDGAVQQVKSEASQLVRRAQPQEQQAQQVQQQLDQSIERMNQSAPQGIQPDDKEEVVNLLVTGANVPQAEAQQAVERWASQLESSARSQQQQPDQQQQQGQQQQLEEKATKAAQAGAEGISTAMWAMFVYLILTLAAGAIGGLVGAPKRREGGPGEREHRRRRTPPSTTAQTTTAPTSTSTTTTPPDRPAS